MNLILRAALTSGGHGKGKVTETTAGEDLELEVMLWGLEGQKRLVSSFP